MNSDIAVTERGFRIQTLIELAAVLLEWTTPGAAEPPGPAASVAAVQLPIQTAPQVIPQRSGKQSVEKSTVSV